MNTKEEIKKKFHLKGRRYLIQLDNPRDTFNETDIALPKKFIPIYCYFSGIILKKGDKCRFETKEGERIYFLRKYMVGSGIIGFDINELRNCIIIDERVIDLKDDGQEEAKII